MNINIWNLRGLGCLKRTENIIKSFSTFSPSLYSTFLSHNKWKDQDNMRRKDTPNLGIKATLIIIFAAPCWMVRSNNINTLSLPQHNTIQLLTKQSNGLLAFEGYFIVFCTFALSCDKTII